MVFKISQISQMYACICDTSTQNQLKRQTHPVLLELQLQELQLQLQMQLLVGPTKL